MCQGTGADLGVGRRAAAPLLLNNFFFNPLDDWNSWFYPDIVFKEHNFCLRNSKKRSSECWKSYLWRSTSQFQNCATIPISVTGPSFSISWIRPWGKSAFESKMCLKEIGYNNLSSQGPPLLKCLSVGKHNSKSWSWFSRYDSCQGLIVILDEDYKLSQIKFVFDGRERQVWWAIK